MVISTHISVTVRISYDTPQEYHNIPLETVLKFLAHTNYVHTHPRREYLSCDWAERDQHVGFVVYREN